MLDSVVTLCYFTSFKKIIRSGFQVAIITPKELSVIWDFMCSKHSVSSPHHIIMWVGGANEATHT